MYRTWDSLVEDYLCGHAEKVLLQPHAHLHFICPLHSHCHAPVVRGSHSGDARTTLSGLHRVCVTGTSKWERDGGGEGGGTGSGSRLGKYQSVTK